MSAAGMLPDRHEHMARSLRHRAFQVRQGVAHHLHFQAQFPCHRAP